LIGDPLRSDKAFSVSGRICVTRGVGDPILYPMNRIEKAIAVPVRHIVHPAQMTVGLAIMAAGVTLLLAQGVPPL
jgi:hypothetical protein